MEAGGRMSLYDSLSLSLSFYLQWIEFSSPHPLLSSLPHGDISKTTRSKTPLHLVLNASSSLMALTNVLLSEAAAAISNNVQSDRENQLVSFLPSFAEKLA
jgi:hypothetical protein